MTVSWKAAAYQGETEFDSGMTSPSSLDTESEGPDRDPCVVKYLQCYEVEEEEELDGDEQ